MYEYRQLALGVILVFSGALNSIAGKIRSKPLGAYDYFVSLANGLVYSLFYLFILGIRTWTGAVSAGQFRYVFCSKPTSPFNSVVDSGPLSRNAELQEPLVPHRPPAEGRQRPPRSSLISTFKRKWASWGAWKYLVITGATDALGNILGFISQPWVPGVIFSLMTQCVILFLVLLGIIILHERYTLWQVVSLLILIVGALTALLPQFAPAEWGVAGGTCTANECPNGSLPAADVRRMTFFTILTAISTLPTALSFIVKEFLFKDYEAYVKHHHSSSLNADDSQSDVLLQTNSTHDGLSAVCSSQGSSDGSSLRPRVGHQTIKGSSNSGSSVSGIYELPLLGVGNERDTNEVQQQYSSISSGGLTNIPSTSSSQLQQQRHQDRTQQQQQTQSLDIFVVAAFGSVAQLLFVPVALPLNILLGQTHGASLTAYIRDGWMCFRGITPNSCVIYNANCASWGCCKYSLLSYAAYICVNCIFNTTILALLRYGSALFAFVCVKAVLPLSIILYVAYPWPLLSTDDAGVSKTVVGSAIIIVTGIASFKAASIQKATLIEKQFDGRQPPCLWPLNLCGRRRPQRQVAAAPPQTNHNYHYAPLVDHDDIPVPLVD